MPSCASITSPSLIAASKSKRHNQARALASNAGGLRRNCAPTLGCYFEPQLWAHYLGRYDERGDLILNLKPATGKAAEKTRAGKVQRPTFPPHRLRELNETGHFTCYKKRKSDSPVERGQLVIQVV